MVRKIGGRRPKAKTAKRKTHRRRRISGAGDVSGMAQKAGGLVLGAVAARELNTLAVKMLPSLSPLMSGVLQMAVGFVLPKFVKGAFFQNLGDGMVANGGMVAIVSTGVITGEGNMMAYKLNGTSRLNVVNGTARLNVVNGIAGPGTRVNNQPGSTVPVIRTRNFSMNGTFQ